MWTNLLGLICFCCSKISVPNIIDNLLKIVESSVQKCLLGLLVERELYCDQSTLSIASHSLHREVASFSHHLVFPKLNKNLCKYFGGISFRTSENSFPLRQVTERKTFDSSPVLNLFAFKIDSTFETKTLVFWRVVALHQQPQPHCTKK